MLPESDAKRNTSLILDAPRVPQNLLCSLWGFASLQHPLPSFTLIP